jgi:hypothetical protein
MQWAPVADYTEFGYLLCLYNVFQFPTSVIVKYSPSDTIKASQETTI